MLFFSHLGKFCNFFLFDICCPWRKHCAEILDALPFFVFFLLYFPFLFSVYLLENLTPSFSFTWLHLKIFLFIVDLLIWQINLKSFLIGWICYAEKTHGSYILPYISTTKSPQQIMGSLVKDFLASALGRTPDSMYHVTVMPCFDKKLEASRSDFFNDIYQTRDVDCVITSG